MFMKDSEYRFLDYTLGPIWTGNELHHHRNYSVDGGETWTMQHKTQLFGAYFFMAEDIVQHSKNLYDLFNLLSDFGGMWLTFILAIFILMGELLNNYFIISKIIRANYYIKKDEQRQVVNQINNLCSIRFSFRHKIKLLFKKCLPKKL